MNRWGISKHILLLIPVLLFAVVYGRSLDYEFVWTDHGEIETGLLIVPTDRIGYAFGRQMMIDLRIRISSDVQQPYYRPMQIASLSLIDHFLGRQPRNFRALNFLLGATTVYLVGWIGLLLLNHRGAAVVGGSIFAVHPVNLENYTWIAGLSHALAALFIAVCLLSGIAMLRANTKARAATAAAASALALLLALLSKENAVATPLLFMACAISIAARIRSEEAPPRRRLREPERRALALVAIQCLIACGFFLWWRPHVLGGWLSDTAPLANSMRVQILTAMSTWPGALGWLLVPLHSSTSDVVTVVGSPRDWKFLLAIFLAGGSVAAWFLCLRSGREMVALGIAWVWIAFAPTSGIVPLNHLFAERYLSLSLFGLALLLPALGLVMGASRPTVRRFVLPALSVLLVLGLADRTWRRMPDWRSDKALFTSDVNRDPLYREGRFELTRVQVGEGDLRGAKASIEELSKLAPAFATRASYYKPDSAFGLYCRINLELGSSQDSLSYIESLTADSWMIAGQPRISICGARTFHAAGESERAISILRAISQLKGSPFRTESVLRLAQIFADLRRFEEARDWLDGIRLEGVRRSVLFFEIRELRGRIRQELPGG